MLYSSYRRWTIFVATATAAGTSILMISISLDIGIILGVPLCVFFGLATWIHLRNTEDMLQEHGGRIPMPNAALGFQGIDIVEDKYAGSYVDPLSEAAIDYSSNELDRHPLAAHCPNCHAPLPSPDVRFCNECGAELRHADSPPHSASTST